MNFANPHFAEPRWLWLAVLGPLVLVALQRYSAWARRKQLAQTRRAALRRGTDPLVQPRPPRPQERVARARRGRGGSRPGAAAVGRAGGGQPLVRPGHPLCPGLLAQHAGERRGAQPPAARQAGHPRLRAAPRPRPRRAGRLRRPGLSPMPAHLRLRRLPGRPDGHRRQDHSRPRHRHRPGAR